MKSSAMAPRTSNYEAGVVAILTIAVGIMSFEQTSISYLIPFIKPDLKINNTQAGMLFSAYWVSFAISSLAMGGLVDALGRRKVLLVAILASISFGALLSGVAGSFPLLLAARALMGLLEGPIVQVAQTIAALESSSARRGTNMGIVGNLGGAILGMFVAPLVLVRIAERFSWHAGFFVVAVPGLLCAFVAALYVREPTIAGSALQDAQPLPGNRDGRTVEVLRFRNVSLCAALCCLFVAYLSLGFAFIPLYYVDVRHFSSERMSILMGVLGISAVLYAVLMPVLSDRIGRKPIMIAASLLSCVCPLAVVYFTGTVLSLGVILVFAWAMPSTGGLIMGTIPSETVPARSISTAIGLIVAIGVLVGGLAGPTFAGWCADHWGLRAPLLLQAACAALAALVSLYLRETAPRRIRKLAATLGSVR